MNPNHLRSALRAFWRKPKHVPPHQHVEVEWVSSKEFPTLRMMTWIVGDERRSYRWWQIEVEPSQYEIKSTKQYVELAYGAISYLCALLLPTPRPKAWRLFSRRPCRCR